MIGMRLNSSERNESADFKELDEALEMYGIDLGALARNRLEAHNPSVAPRFGAYVNHAGKVNTADMQRVAYTRYKAAESNQTIDASDVSRDWDKFRDECVRLIEEEGVLEEELLAHIKDHIALNTWNGLNYNDILSKLGNQLKSAAKSCKGAVAINPSLSEAVKKILD